MSASDVIPATVALRAQVCRAAAWCGIEIAEVAEALGLTENSLRAWLRRWIDGAAWPPEIDAIERLLAQPVETIHQSLGPVGRLSQIAEDLWGLPRGAVASKVRTRTEVRARQAVCWAIKRYYGDAISFPIIGRALGGRDHSTVIHAIRTADEVRARDADYAAFCDLLLVHVAAGAPSGARNARPLPEWAVDPKRWMAAKALSEAAENDCDEIDEARQGTWCDQCDQLVGADRAGRCADRWCSLKVRA